ncbi:MAG: hypothetical protein B6I20_12990 [Bacteroidetes bacterium 4572_117]|nr:MAG: hypothetical protein B6I20_12990 [Bacteroidetes bacterium 4572_117]
MMKMKKIKLVMVCIILTSAIIYAQNDTTKIKLGKTKVIIIDSDEIDNNNKLEKGKEKFEKLFSEKKKEHEKSLKELELLEKQLNEASDDDIRKKLEEDLAKQKAQNEDIKKELGALEKGIDDINDKINQKEDDENWDDDKDFDWDSNDDWYADWDKFTPFKKKKRFEGHWAGFEIGLNTYVDSEYKTVLDGNELFELNPERSWVFNINFIEFSIPFGKSAGLVTGMGATWNKYQFRNNVNVFENSEGTIVAEKELVKEYEKNSLNLWYMSIPLLFEFQIPVARSKPGIHVSFGVVGSLKLDSRAKQHTKDDEYVVKSDFQIPGFKYGFTARIGYKFIKLFANYDVVPLFKEGRGPEVYPVSAGITLISF